MKRFSTCIALAATIASLMATAQTQQPTTLLCSIVQSLDLGPDEKPQYVKGDTSLTVDFSARVVTDSKGRQHQATISNSLISFRSETDNTLADPNGDKSKEVRIKQSNFGSVDRVSGAYQETIRVEVWANGVDTTSNSKITGKCKARARQF